MESLQPEDELLLAIVDPILSVDSDQALRQRLASAGSSLNWGRFIAQATHHQVLPMVSRRLITDRIAFAPDGSAAIPFRWLHAYVLQAGQDRYDRTRAEYGTVLDALTSADLHYVVKKGPVFSELLYNDPSTRRVSDLDLMLDRSEIDVYRQVLTECGFVQGELSESGAVIRPFPDATQDFWETQLPHTSLPFAKVGDGSLIESFIVGAQFSIFQPLGDDAQHLLKDRVPVDLYGSSSYMLPWSVQLLDTAVQIFYRANIFYYIESMKDHMLRNYLDLALLSRRSTESSWDLVATLADRFGCANQVFFALHQARELFPSLFERGVLERFRCEGVGEQFLDSYGAGEGGPYIWNVPFVTRVFDRGMMTVEGRSAMPGHRSIV